MKKGFTLLELMVASLLLSMLVTVLTMVFNSSSIAWRTGTAGVAELKNVRTELGTFHDIMDDLLPGLGQKNVSGGASDNREIKYRTVSVWDPDQENTLRSDRAFVSDFKWGGVSRITLNEAMTGQKRSLNGAGTGFGASLFNVGVRSAGPDGKWDTEDDISTWPKEVD